MQTKNVIRTSLFALGVAASVAASAGVPIDTTGATLQVAGKDGIQFTNLTVPGYGNYSLRFKWNPDTLSFVYDPASLSVASTSRCTSRLYKIPNDSYYAWTSIRVVNGVEYGGLIDVSASVSPDNISLGYLWSDFVVNWARTAKATDNPYLTGRTVPTFDPTKGYGFVADDGYGFAQGDLVEITANPEVDNFLTIKQVNGSQAITLNSGVVRTNTQGCVSGTATYSGRNSSDKAVISISGDVGSLQANSLQATWSVSTGSGIVGTGSGSEYGGLLKDTKILVRDVGDGITLIGLDANGKAISSYTFLRP
jgi:cold shock CspA family protein